MPEPLRVAYTLEQCWHDVPGGTAAAAIAVAARLADRSDVELIGVAGRHRDAPAAPYVPPIDVVQLPISRPWLYETWNRCHWPRVERASGQIDVCHSTTAIPAATAAPHVVTVHDIAFVHTPERFSRHGARVMRAGLERCRLADLVLCPSQATADDLVADGFDGDRLRIVPWGVTAVATTDADVHRVRRTYGLPERFVLFVGTIEPRKNLGRLADAVTRLGPAGLPLVVVGASGWGDVDVPDRASVNFVGFVPADDLAALYVAATVFAYPSLHEGFGLPILEAMVQGTPVVTSRGSSTEEVAGGAAVLVDAGDVESIAAGICEAIADANGWIDRGRARAAAMTWDAAAAATLAAYREVAR